MGWIGHIVYMDEVRNTYKIFIGKSSGKKPLVRPKHRWKVNIKLDLGEIDYEGLD
jgi:hypothetical protein